MTTIHLHKGSIALPEHWDEVPQKHIEKIFDILSKVLSRDLDPLEARLQMLFVLANYRPSITLRNRDAININLFRLSEQLKFAFTVENGTVAPCLTFRRNPVPELKSGKTKYAGRNFTRDFTVKTDITAREFCDCFDFYCEYHRNPENTKPCIDNICSILYSAPLNIPDSPLKFGIFIWFSSIVNFFYTHPVYSILFGSGDSQKTGSDKINFGMSETILSLIHEGYPGDMNLIDFFNAQIKLIKDNIRNAVASGAKITDIAAKTGLTVSTLNKLT
jgi:hypothetical protein